MIPATLPLLRDPRRRVEYAAEPLQPTPHPVSGPLKPQSGGSAGPLSVPSALHAAQGAPHPVNANIPIDAFAGQAKTTPPKPPVAPESQPAQQQGTTPTPYVQTGQLQQHLAGRAANSPRETARTMTHGYDWGDAGHEDRLQLQNHLENQPVENLWNVAHHIGNALARGDRPHAEFARQQIVHTLAHALDAGERDLTPDNRSRVVVIDDSQMDPDQQAQLHALVRAFPRVRGMSNAVFLPGGDQQTLNALLGPESQLRTESLAVHEQRQRLAADKVEQQRQEQAALTPQSVEAEVLPLDQQIAGSPPGELGQALAAHDWHLARAHDGLLAMHTLEALPDDQFNEALQGLAQGVQQRAQRAQDTTGIDRDAHDKSQGTIRSIIRNALMHRDPPAPVPLTAENAGQARFISFPPGTSEQHQDLVRRTLRGLTPIEGQPDTYLVPEGVDLPALFGESLPPFEDVIPLQDSDKVPEPITSEGVTLAGDEPADSQAQLGTLHRTLLEYLKHPLRPQDIDETEVEGTRDEINRAVADLHAAGLLQRNRIGTFETNDSGREALAAPANPAAAPQRIVVPEAEDLVQFLMQFGPSTRQDLENAGWSEGDIDSAIDAGLGEGIIRAPGDQLTLVNQGHPAVRQQATTATSALSPEEHSSLGQLVDFLGQHGPMSYNDLQNAGWSNSDLNRASIAGRRSGVISEEDGRLIQTGRFPPPTPQQQPAQQGGFTSDQEDAFAQMVRSWPSTLNMGPGELSEFASHHGIASARVRQHAAELARQGQLVDEGNGHYSVPLRQGTQPSTPAQSMQLSNVGRIAQLLMTSPNNHLSHADLRQAFPDLDDNALGDALRSMEDSAFAHVTSSGASLTGHGFAVGQQQGWPGTSAATPVRQANPTVPATARPQPTPLPARPGTPAPHPDEPWQGEHADFINHWGGEQQRQNNVLVHYRGSIHDTTHLFGRDLEPHEIAAIANAGGDAEVHIHVYSNSLNVRTVGDGLKASRDIRMSRAGVLVCDNNSFKIENGSPHDKRGFTFTARQMAALKRLGVDHVETYAAGNNATAESGGYNGFITWPKFRFEGRMDPGQFRRLPDRIRRAMGNNLEIFDLMDIPGGPEAWYEVGSGLNLIFSLKDGSRNLKGLEAYIMKRLEKDKAKGITYARDEHPMSNAAAEPEATPEQIDHIHTLTRKLRDTDMDSNEYQTIKAELDRLIYATGYAEGRGVEA